MIDMVRFGICDDDYEYMEKLVEIIREKYHEMTSSDEECEFRLFAESKDALLGLRTERIDIMFIDIEYGNVSGFDIAKRMVSIRRELGIVYITNHEHYVTEAFVARPLGFIRKQCIERDIRMPMCNIIEYLEDTRVHITIGQGAGKRNIYLRDIVSFEVFDHQIKITRVDDVVVFRGQLNKYENVLIKYGLIKISRWVIINKKYIQSIDGDTITMITGDSFVVSRRKYKILEDML